MSTKPICLWPTPRARLHSPDTTKQETSQVNSATPELTSVHLVNLVQEPRCPPTLTSSLVAMTESIMGTAAMSSSASTASSTPVGCESWATRLARSTFRTSAASRTPVLSYPYSFMALESITYLRTTHLHPLSPFAFCPHPRITGSFRSADNLCFYPPHHRFSSMPTVSIHTIFLLP